MKAITVTLPVSARYYDDRIRLEHASAELALPLEQGEHVVHTPVTVVGERSGGEALGARLSVWYEYCVDEDVITLCAPEFDTKDMTSVTLQAGDNTLCTFAAHPAVVMKAAPGAEQFLERPEFDRRMTKMLSGVAEAIQQEALRCGLTVQMRTPPPQLTRQEEEDLQLLFQSGAGGDSFAGFAQPGRTYGNGITVHPLGSAWGGEVTFRYGEYFANVIGSTGDRKIGGNTWIGLWQNQFGPANTCTSLNFNHFGCSGNILGGHVVSGRQALRVAAGSNAVYIMPICCGHNNNDNVYMSALQYQRGIWLTNYHNP